VSNAATRTAQEDEHSTASQAQLRVLLAEDNLADRELILRELRKSKFEIVSEVVHTIEEFRQQVKAYRPDVVLVGYNLQQWNSVEALEILQAEGLDIPLIVVSGTLGAATVVECVKQDTADYVWKDSLAPLTEALRGALKKKKTREELKRAQEALAGKIEELAHSNAALEQFAYAASHDLQEPLRMVSAYTQLLAERYRGKLDDQADQYIHYAVDGAVRMQSLVHDLLTFSRVGRQGNAVTSADCNEIMKRVMENLRPAIAESSSVVTHEPLPSLMANQSQLQQVLERLIANAIKFRGPQSPIIHVAAEKRATEWVFSVADNGIGISPEHAENVFIIFKRLHTRAEYPGNGVGLAICRRIVEGFGGKIQALPLEGGGTIFKFSLPAGKSAQQNQS
jgi:signal transduction histidine kinase